MLAPLLATSNPWRLGDPSGKNRDAITKELVFATHADAIAFIVKLAMHSESVNHHPEYAGVYNRLRITLTTHECNGISQIDIDMARFCDANGPSQ